MVEYYKNLDLENIAYFCDIDNKWKFEQWKDIPRFENLYQVSNLGRLKRLSRRVVHKDGSFLLKEQIMKGSKSPKGYLTVGIGIDLKHDVYRRHRLVAEAFVPNPENKPDVNHKKGIKWDNRATELEWCTQKENTAHALETGLKNCNKGNNNINSKLSDKDVLEIRKSDLSIKDLSIRYSVSRTTISCILQNITWKHIN